MIIRNIIEGEKPREKLLKYGVERLSDDELLSIILKTGTYNKNVRELSLEIIDEFRGINNFCNMKLSTLKNIKGIGNVKAMELISTIELGRRIFLREDVNNKKRLVNAELIWKNTKYLFFDKNQEYFYALYFNNKQELIEEKLLFVGTINKSIVHPREIFKEAYLLSASSIVCIHNHPSGDVNPSVEDINFTRNLFEIGKLQGIPIVDHLIVSNNRYYSFYNSGNVFNT